MSDIASRKTADRLLSALGEQLAAANERYELVVIGGSGLLALGLIERSTRDVDLLALRAGDELNSARPLPSVLEAARDRVARDYSLPTDWLNPGPTDLLRFGLPDGFIDRLERRDYGDNLSVFLASRYDQNEADLRALSPTEEELFAAAHWSRSHDPSEGYAQMLRDVLTRLGVDDVDLGR